jgi:hypothetical protein
VDEPLEVPEIRRDGVRNAALEIAPNEFVRVEFGGIAWEAMQLQAGSRAQKLAHEDTSMLIDIIPDDVHRTPQTLEQQAQESNDIRRPDVPVAQKSGVKRDAPSFGGDADRRDRGYLGPASGATQNGSLTSRRPCPSDGRDQQESALVNEYEMGASLLGFFL